MFLDVYWLSLWFPCFIGFWVYLSARAPPFQGSLLELLPNSYQSEFGNHFFSGHLNDNIPKAEAFAVDDKLRKIAFP